jgi:regulator of RNase E activity RraA
VTVAPGDAVLGDVVVNTDAVLDVIAASRTRTRAERQVLCRLRRAGAMLDIFGLRTGADETS